MNSSDSRFNSGTIYRRRINNKRVTKKKRIVKYYYYRRSHYYKNRYYTGKTYKVISGKDVSTCLNYCIKDRRCKTWSYGPNYR